MRNFIALLLILAVLTGECAAESWEVVKPAGLGFEVELPGKPEYDEQSDDLGGGEKGMIRTYVVKSSSAAYDVTIFDLPKAGVAPEDVSQVLDNVRDRTLDGVTATLRTETKVDIGGHPARDVTADVMGMVWRGRIVIAGNRLYQVVAIISKAAETSATTERYFASFKLSEPAATSPGP
jgi:hypothetical protein